MKQDEYSPEINQKMSQIISEALDEVYPQLSQHEKALSLVFLKTRIRESIEELFIMLEQGYDFELMKMHIICTLVDGEIGEEMI